MTVTIPFDSSGDREVFKKYAGVGKKKAANSKGGKKIAEAITEETGWRRVKKPGRKR